MITLLSELGRLIQEFEDEHLKYHPIHPTTEAPEFEGISMSAHVTEQGLLLKFHHKQIGLSPDCYTRMFSFKELEHTELGVQLFEDAMSIAVRHFGGE